MARHSRKRPRKDQEQPAEINAKKPQLLNPETESTQLPKDPQIQMVDYEEVKKIEGNEPNQFHRSGPDSDSTQGKENDLDSEHHVLAPIDSNTVLVPEPEPFVVVKNEANGPLDSTTPRKKKSKRKRKGKSLLTSDGGAETNDVQSENREVITHLGPLSSKDSEPVLLPPEPEPVAENDGANQLCIEPESTPSRKKRKRKGKSVSTSEGTEANNVHSKHCELIPNLDLLSHDDFSQNQSQLLPESEPVADKNEETNQLFTESESATPRKKKRKGKGKGENMSTSEGTETNVVNSEQRELIPNLDPLTPKDADSGSVLLPQPESFAEKNDTNQLCTEPELVTPRKKRKGKRKSLSKSEGVEMNHVDSEHHELSPDLAALPPKDADPLLLPEPAPVGEKDEANRLCTKPDPTSPKFEGAEIKDMGSENLDLCPKLDPLPHNDTDPLLFSEPEPVPIKGVDQKKKRRKKKNMGELKGEGVESNRPNDEHSQQCHNARPTTPEERNQRKRKRQVMNETQDSSVQSMVTPYLLHSEAVERGPRISKRPLKRYEHYERCLECRQICQGDQICSGRKHVSKYSQICYFCGTHGHLLGMCPMSPGAKCAKGIIMLDDYVRKKCSKKSESMCQKGGSC